MKIIRMERTKNCAIYWRDAIYLHPDTTEDGFTVGELKYKLSFLWFWYEDLEFFIEINY